MAYSHFSGSATCKSSFFSPHAMCTRTLRSGPFQHFNLGVCRTILMSDIPDQLQNRKKKLTLGHTAARYISFHLPFRQALSSQRNDPTNAWLRLYYSFDTHHASNRAYMYSLPGRGRCIPRRARTTRPRDHSLGHRWSARRQRRGTRRPMWSEWTRVGFRAT